MTEAVTTAQLREDARAAADAVADAGGLTIREVTEPAEHRAVEQLLSGIWSTGQEPSPMPGDVMRMLSYTGSYVAGAYVAGRLVGAGVGFLTDESPDIGAAHLHSHVVGVAPQARGRQVGYALKLHQRAWALERDYRRITWTFDPVVCRNAHFNLNKLGARATRYLVDFYGDMPDRVNAGQGSDRLLVDWPLDAPEVQAAARGHRTRPTAWPNAPRVLRRGPGDIPQRADRSEPGPAVCEIPGDIEALRRADPDLGVAWRLAVRAVLSRAMSDGLHITGFDRSIGYLLGDFGAGR